MNPRKIQNGFEKNIQIIVSRLFFFSEAKNDGVLVVLHRIDGSSAIETRLRFR